MNIYNLKKSTENETDFNLSSTQHEISLVEGKYNSAEAQERLMRILLDNINYHSLKSFISTEKFGQPDKNAENKVAELEEFREKISTLATLAKNSGRRIDVQAHIKVNLV